MSPVHPLPALLAILLALGTTHWLARHAGFSPGQGRNASIDGLRGYLAFFVFLHHSSIWYFYLRNGQWDVPPSHLYTHFGQSGVALFFMVSGYLFFSKLIDARRKQLDFTRLYVSRATRLVPLYAFAMLLLFVVVAMLSGWQLREPAPRVASDALRWLGFTFGGSPDINGVEHTSIIIARVTWTLRYEWYFYLSLPLLTLLVGVLPPFRFIVLGLAGVALMWALQANTVVLMVFLGGIAAAVLVRSERFCRLAQTRAASLAIVAFLGSAVTFHPGAYEIGAMLLLGLAFCLVAGGNSLFGLLLLPASRLLGEVSYSVYLLHGILLFVVFGFVLDRELAAGLPVTMHWLIVLVASPVLVLGCFVTYRCIELPAMRQTNRLTAWLRGNRTR